MQPEGGEGDATLDLEIYSDHQRGWWDFQASGQLRVVGYTGSLAPESGTLSEDRRRITWVFPSTAALVRRDLTCVTSIRLGEYADNPDEVAPFFFVGLSPSPPPPDTSAPTVAWRSPRDGDVISGIWQEAGVKGRHVCRIDAQDAVGVVRVDVLLDRRFLNREFYAPWACVPECGLARLHAH